MDREVEVHSEPNGDSYEKTEPITIGRAPPEVRPDDRDRDDDASLGVVRRDSDETVRLPDVSDTGPREFADLAVARNAQSSARVYGATLEIMEPVETVELRRFTRKEYDALVKQGWFENEPIELLRGMLVKMSPQGTDHNGIVDDIMHVFARALPIETFGVRAHSAFAATDDSEPEPDFYVYRKPRPSDSHPTSALLLVEVSRSSLRRDRTVKLSIYAQNGVPEYWIVDLEAREVEVYTQPEGHEYRQLERIQIDGELRPRFDPTIVIAMSSLPWADPIS